MVALRAPFSTLGGVVLSAALFLGLAQLVNVPLEIGERIVVDPIALKPPRVDTPLVQPTPPISIAHAAPVVAPGLPHLRVDDVDISVERVRYTRPTLVAGPGRSELGLRGIDGDVIPIVRHPPEYPPRLLYTSTEGWVRVKFTVNSVGAVRDAVVVDSEPGSLFDDAALEAIARWRYNPRVVNGEAVERVGLQTVIRFELEK